MPRYRDAVAWIIDNDDNEWLKYPADSGEGSGSVTAAFLADLWNKTDEQVRTDLLAERERRRLNNGRT